MNELADGEQALWHAWKLASERIRARVTEDINAAVGLSDADFGVLTRVDDSGGRMRQNALAESMGWHRSRLSHQLGRMAQRGLLTRGAVDGGVEVRLTDEGAEQIRRARPVHAAAVRRHLLDRLTSIQQQRLTQLLRVLAAE